MRSDLGFRVVREHIGVFYYFEFVTKSLITKEHRWQLTQTDSSKHGSISTLLPQNCTLERSPTSPLVHCNFRRLWREYFHILPCRDEIHSSQNLPNLLSYRVIGIFMLRITKLTGMKTYVEWSNDWYSFELLHVIWGSTFLLGCTSCSL